jgi:cytochrome P450
VVEAGCSPIWSNSRANANLTTHVVVVYGEIFTKMSAITVLPYGKAFTLQRKLFNHALKPSNFPSYQPRQVAEATKLTMHILQDPKKWMSSIDRFFASITFTITYGRRGMSLKSSIFYVTPPIIYFIGTKNC